METTEMLTCKLLKQSFSRTLTFKKKEVIVSFIILNERSNENFNTEYRILKKEENWCNLKYMHVLTYNYILLDILCNSLKYRLKYKFFCKV